MTKRSKLFDFENLDDHEEAVPPSPSVAMSSTNLRSALVDRYREDQSSHNNSNSSNYESTSESDDDTILALVTKKKMFEHQHQLQ